MFDFKTSTHNHYEEACRKFALTHNMQELALRAGMKVQTLRNKLNPEQAHQLTVPEVLTLTDLTEDATLIDGMLAQLQCLPCMPVNELAKEKFSAYVLKATAEVGSMAANAANPERITATCRRGILEAANTGIRCMMLAALAVQNRVHSNPTLASTVDAISGLGASIGIS
ncbi:MULTISPECIES: phage regulatory CII family protein [unclassified Pantoea]|uniref:phage regulatory CII family protein n=1 Tax=unclassified Pantoea TaxID=2630326 RepID=UPI00053471EE|nr:MULTISPECIES: phage regulatory CII family protein [unclassified Pantoea]MDU6388629.1 phage regulatory CII family protein [Pantoea sp.]